MSMCRKLLGVSNTVAGLTIHGWRRLKNEVRKEATVHVAGGSGNKSRTTEK